MKEKICFDFYININQWALPLSIWITDIDVSIQVLCFNFHWYKGYEWDDDELDNLF